MKYLSLLIIFLCVVLQSSVISYPFTILAVTVISIFREDEVVELAFVSGILLDLFSIRLLGVDSLYFLLIIYLGNRYRKKIHQGAFIYRFVYVMVPYVFYDALFHKTQNIVIHLGTTVFVCVILFWYEKLFPVNNKRRLEV